MGASYISHVPFGFIFSVRKGMSSIPLDRSDTDQLCVEYGNLNCGNIFPFLAEANMSAKITKYYNANGLRKNAYYTYY